MEFLAFTQGGGVRLRKLGAKVYVDVDSGSGYTTQAIFTMNPAKQVKLGLKAGEDASIVLGTPAIVSLVGTVEVAKKDYDPEVDLDPMRPKDISFNEYYGV